jgi:hypothetical protein
MITVFIARGPPDLPLTGFHTTCQSPSDERPGMPHGAFTPAFQPRSALIRKPFAGCHGESQDGNAARPRSP